jgi:hypothetical protein
MIYLEFMPAQFTRLNGYLMEERRLDGARFTREELDEILPHSPHGEKIERRWFGGRLFPSHRHQAELRCALGIDRNLEGIPVDHPTAHIQPSGWDPNFYEVSEEFRQSQTASMLQQWQPYCAIPELDPSAREVVEGFLDLCRANGIRVKILLMPESVAFRSIYHPVLKLNFAQWMQDLKQTKGIEVVDGSEWMPDHAFWDGHHMILPGAQEFSVRFGRDVFSHDVQHLTGINAGRRFTKR